MSVISPFSVFDLLVPIDETGVTAQYHWLCDYETLCFSSIGFDDLRQLFDSSFDNSAIPDMWRGRAHFMCSSVFPALIQLRNDYGVKLNYPRLKEAISYSGIISLFDDDRLNLHSKEALHKYIQDLPGRVGSENSRGVHGYLSIQFSSWLATMCELNHSHFVRLATQIIRRPDGVNLLLSDNEKQKALSFNVLRQWLLGMGVEQDEIISNATNAQRRELLLTDLDV